LALRAECARRTVTARPWVGAVLAARTEETDGRPLIAVVTDRAGRALCHASRAECPSSTRVGVGWVEALVASFTRGAGCGACRAVQARHAVGAAMVALRAVGALRTQGREGSRRDCRVRAVVATWTDGA